ncbi:uncharacterized protein LY89DRAFT_780166 [Mollisia scopiformis]|uniref:Zn(2)-C6 fungal-type domain-containing protein n=1 Tax=Mollisia scopiformis TaxID=149040 RepID=A0A194XHB1_MOLSC|nr:uncharacterized protein LY89DRAFT_780166 [Mollisia scopiformis]KUJ19157.1 hypothetical protein LY89DRAFT_780166 [Mollisia scopiformis]
MDKRQNKTSRRACAFCRKRKLRCDRANPCGSCQKFGFECQYICVPDGRVSKSVSKSSRVNQLENRLYNVEQLLQSTSQDSGQIMNLSPNESLYRQIDDLAALSSSTIRSLEQAFFDFVHPVISLIHRGSYMESKATTPCYLTHAIWALGALNSEVHTGWSEQLYYSSRQKLEEAELKDRRFDRVTLAQAQAVILISYYELHQGFFHRSWISIAKAVRLVQVMKLHRLDGISQFRHSLESISTPKVITEAETKRRAFWHTFLLDRYCFVSTGSPTLIQEKDIYTYLPASDDAFAKSFEERYVVLQDALTTTTINQPLCSFAALVILLCQSISKLRSLDQYEMHIDATESLHNDLHSKSDLLQTALGTVYRVPKNLGIETSLLDPSLAYLHTATSTSTITLHIAARALAQDNVPLPESWPPDNKQCLEAATNITNVLEITNSWDLRSYHFLTLYSIYSAVAAFANSWLVNPQPSYKRSLRFLLNKLESFKPRIRLAHILLQDIDTEFPELQHRLRAQGESANSQSALCLDWEAQVVTHEHNKAFDFSDAQEHDPFLGDTNNWCLDEDHLYLNVFT